MVYGGLMIGVVYGGCSLEHDVSVISAEAFLSEISAEKFYISKDGKWYVNDQPVNDPLPFLKQCEVIFPLIHGGPGEDGTIQGFFEMNQIAYVGCGVKSSALCMDKDLSKRILESHNLPVTPFKTFSSLQEALNTQEKLPCIVKPASLGSTFGVIKVEKDLPSALKEVFKLDEKVIIEEFVEAREIWVSVLEKDGKLICSPPCEFVKKDSVFSYDDKYTKGRANYHFPAENINSEAFIEIAKKVFRVLECAQMARIDLFLKEDGTILVNEVNTIPGFTPGSLYPKALSTIGIDYKELVSILTKGALKTKSAKYTFRNSSSTKEGMLV